MSNIFITDIVGQNDFAVPASDAALATATTALDDLIDDVVGLKYARVLAWVETSSGTGVPRTLNCLIERFQYDSGGGYEECPNATEVDDLTDDIKTTLEADADITSIGPQYVSIYIEGEYYLWERDPVTGVLFPGVDTDDVAVGGSTPNGKWFQDGDLVLGAAAMSGTEKLRVVGSGRIEGGWLMTEFGSVPATPGLGEGTFWVENTSPTLPKFTDETPTDYTLAYISNVTSLYGIQQVIFVDKTYGSYTAKGTMQAPFNTITEGISAAVTAGASATNRFMVFVYPGLYVETLNLSTAGIFVVGTSPEDVIVQQSSGSGIMVQTGAEPVGVLNVTFRSVYTYGGFLWKNSASTGSVPNIFRNCYFQLANANNYLVFDAQGWYQFVDCRFSHTTSTERIGSFYPSSGSSWRADFHNCTFTGYGYFENGGDILENFFGCCFRLGRNGGIVTKESGNGYLRMFGCNIENTDTGSSAAAVYAAGGAKRVELHGCNCYGGANATYDFNTGTSAVTECVVKGTHFRSGGMRGYVQTNDTFKFAAGKPADLDWYKDLYEAKFSVTRSDTVIYVLSDHTYSGTLESNTVDGTVIDGLGHAIQSTGTLFTTYSGRIDFKNIEMTGSVVVGSAANSILMFDNVKLNGRIEFNQTASTAKVYVHDSGLFGTSTYNYPIELDSTASTDCRLVLSHSFAKGYTGYAAVYFDGVDWDNLEMEYTKMFHGDLSTNNPFAGYDDAITYKAHHCVFNQEPALADPTNLTNAIDSGQRYNTVDPDGNYYWIG